MTRSNANTSRDRQLNIALHDDELGALRTRAGTAGMRVVDYARAVLLDKPITVTTAFVPTATDRLVFEQLKRLGNNLNQIARQLNAQKAVPLPEIEALLREIRVALGGMAGHDH